MKSALFLALAAFVATATASTGTILQEEQYQYLFTKWVQQHGKGYEASNDLFGKFNTFKSNVDLIIAHNAKGDETYKMAINKFADLSNDEFQHAMGLKSNRKKLAQKSTLKAAATKASNSTASCNTGFRKSNNNNQQKNVDWSAENMPAVRDQAQCGSCWAFSATGAIAGAYSVSTGIKGGDIPVLSEQEFVDCVNSSYDPSYISEGCGGGLMSEALDYASKEGQCLDADYKYTARDGKCKASSCTPAVQPKGYDEVHGDEELQTQIYNAPISVGIAASSSAFQFYSSGVVTKCTDRALDHGVLAVSYMPEASQPYYLIRNSWGASWGDKGHIKLSTVGNQCGLGTSPWDVIAKF